METDRAGKLVEFSKGFQNLQNKCFVNVDSENAMHTHDHLRDLG